MTEFFFLSDTDLKKKKKRKELCLVTAKDLLLICKIK